MEQNRRVPLTGPGPRLHLSLRVLGSGHQTLTFTKFLSIMKHRTFMPFLRRRMCVLWGSLTGWSDTSASEQLKNINHDGESLLERAWERGRRTRSLRVSGQGSLRNIFVRNQIWLVRSWGTRRPNWTQIIRKQKEMVRWFKPGHTWEGALETKLLPRWPWTRGTFWIQSQQRILSVEKGQAAGSGAWRTQFKSRLRLITPRDSVHNTLLSPFSHL